MTTWPTVLPAPQRGGYSFKPDSQPLRTDTKFGATALRNHKHRSYAQTQLVFKMTPAQYVTFEAFWKYELDNGKNWFDGLTMHDGAKTVRPLDNYNSTYEGSRHAVAFAVEWEL